MKRSDSRYTVVGFMPNDEVDVTVRPAVLFDIPADIALDQPFGFLANGELVTLREACARQINPDSIITQGQVVGRLANRPSPDGVPVTLMGLVVGPSSCPSPHD